MINEPDQILQQQSLATQKCLTIAQCIALTLHLIFTVLNTIVLVNLDCNTENIE